MTTTEIQALVRQALAAREQAYAPYSGFKVGAALLTPGGTVYQGCNIENAAYSPGNCAERTAVFKAVSEGERQFAAIAVVGYADGTAEPGFAYPCGVCRQVMSEFCEASFTIVVAADEARYEVLTLGELLPFGFTL